MRLRDERGMTIIEVLVAMTLATIVFAATLQTFNAINGQHNRELSANDAQDQARTAIDRMMRDLRNLASPTDFALASGTLPNSVDKNSKYDLVFKSVQDGSAATSTNPTGVRRVRYCLGTTAGNTNKVYQQIEPAANFNPSALTAADTSACPATGGRWVGTPKIVINNVTNTLGGLDRPLFTYSADGKLLAYDVATDLPDTTRVEANLYVDPTPNKGAKEVRLSSSVILRNQNRAPVAKFSITKSGRTVTLNASDSDDPESEPMTFDWYEGSTKIGSGIVFTITYTAAGTHTYTLKVHDPAQLEGVAPAQTVTVT